MKKNDKMMKSVQTLNYKSTNYNQQRVTNCFKNVILLFAKRVFNCNKNCDCEPENSKSPAER